MVKRPIKKAKQKSKADKTAKVKLTAGEYVTGSGAPAPPSRTLEEALPGRFLQDQQGTDFEFERRVSGASVAKKRLALVGWAVERRLQYILNYCGERL